MALAFYYTESDPLELEATYPYKAVSAACNLKGKGVVGASTFNMILPEEPEQTLAAL